jgi:hypothetical protein
MDLVGERVANRGSLGEAGNFRRSSPRSIGGARVMTVRCPTSSSRKRRPIRRVRRIVAKISVRVPAPHPYFVATFLWGRRVFLV